MGPEAPAEKQAGTPGEARLPLCLAQPLRPGARVWAWAVRLVCVLSCRAEPVDRPCSHLGCETPPSKPEAEQGTP